jgi:hypothetical protein
VRAADGGEQQRIRFQSPLMETKPGMRAAKTPN